MVSFDSEYSCERCKKRIKKGREVWLYDRPYGLDCARIIVAHEQFFPSVTAILSIPDIRFNNVVLGEDNLFEEYE